MATYGELMDEIQACTTKEQADALLERQIESALKERPELLREEARSIVLSNIGYMTGYLDRAEAARLLELFGARHPIFGDIDGWPKTPEEAIELGMKVGIRKG